MEQTVSQFAAAPQSLLGLLLLGAWLTLASGVSFGLLIRPRVAR